MKKAKKTKAIQKKCLCPYCEAEISLSVLPYCQPCGITLRYCRHCQVAVPREAEVCPECGGKLEGK